jgi:hypothetical protein
MTSSPAVPFNVSDLFVPVIARAIEHRSAATLTLVVAAAVLLLESGSAVAEETVAVLVITVPLAVPAVTLTTSEIEPDVDAASVEVVHVCVPVPPTGSGGHVQPAAGVTETNVVFVGMTSLSETELAACGPSLRTVIEYVMLPPTLTGSGESAFVTRRFAPVPVTVVVVPAVLFPLTPSSGELTVALFVITVPLSVPTATFTTNVIVLEPTPTDGLVHVWVPAPPTGSGGQVHPAPAAMETNVVPAGIVSEMLAFDAASGPAFVTVIV